MKEMQKHDIHDQALQALYRPDHNATNIIK